MLMYSPDNLRFWGRSEIVRADPGSDVGSSCNFGPLDATRRNGHEQPAQQQMLGGGTLSRATVKHLTTGVRDWREGRYLNKMPQQRDLELEPIQSWFDCKPA